jgi:hypothetical protein
VGRNLIFTEPRKRKRWKPHQIRLWKREYGALWLPFEQERIEKFSRVQPGKTVAIAGYVKWVSSQTFALVPTLVSNQIHLLCLNQTERRPRENAYIMVYGPVEWTQITKVESSSTLYRGDRIIKVQDWEDVKPEGLPPKVNFNYRDFRDDLTRRIEGLEPQIADFLAFTALSTPAFYENIGGVHLTLYDSTTSGLPRLIMKEMRRIIPSDIGKLHTVATPFGRFGMRYKYIHVTANADAALAGNTEVFMTKRTRRFVRNYDEVSLSLHSSQQGPKTIEDPPCGLSDIPTVVPEDTWINRKRSTYPEFDSFRYMMIQHMKAPVVENYNKALIDLVNHLERLSQQYGLDPIHLTQYGFLNANYNARPTSIMRQCLSYARAHNIERVQSKDVNTMFGKTPYREQKPHYPSELNIEISSG